MGSIALSVPGYAVSADYFLKSRPQTNQSYLYTGAGWFHDGGDDTDFLVVPVEGRIITSSDWEFAAGTQLFNGTVGGKEGSAVGDVTLSAAKIFRKQIGLDFLSLEVGQVLSVAPTRFSSDTDAYFKLRLQKGPTRARAEFSVTVAEADEKLADYGDVRTTASLGLRSWWGQHRFGTDFVATNRHGMTQQSSVDFVYMHQNWNGSAYYVVLEKGFSDAYDGFYAGVGFEWAIVF